MAFALDARGPSLDEKKEKPSDLKVQEHCDRCFVENGEFMCGATWLILPVVYACLKD